MPEKYVIFLLYSNMTLKDLDFLYILENIKLTHYIGDFMMIGQNEQVSLLNFIFDFCKKPNNSFFLPKLFSLTISNKPKYMRESPLYKYHLFFNLAELKY